MDNFIKAVAWLCVRIFEGLCFGGSLLAIYFVMIALAG